MNMSKILGIIFIITSTSGMGMLYSNKIKYRLKELKELKSMVLLLRGDIRYAKTPLPEAISALGKRSTGNFKSFFTEISKQLKELSGVRFADVWKGSMTSKLVNTNLQKGDKDHLTRLGEQLGYLDKNMQLNTLDLYIEQLDEDIEEIMATMKEKTYLYNSMGVMVGIFISIIML